MNTSVVVPNTLVCVALGDQVGIEGFQIGWRKLGKFFVAQGWNDMDPERCFIALICLGPL